MLVHRARDIHKCLKNIASFTNHQAKVKDWDSEHLEWITIEVIPNGGPYCGGKYEFKIIFGKSYPKHPPQVDCLTPIYHPNIDMTGEDYNVCLSLFDEWQSNFGLEDVIQGILFLMYHPNLEDPLSPWFDPGMSSKEFEENLQKTLRGHIIEDAYDYQFPKMIEGEALSATLNNNDLSTDDQQLLSGDKIENCLECKDKTPDSGGINCNNSEMKSDEQITSEVKEELIIKEDKEMDLSKETDTSENKVTENPVNTDHDEMVEIIENKFMTGFVELMAIELSDCDNDESDMSMTTDDQSTTSYDSIDNDLFELQTSDDNSSNGVTLYFPLFWQRLFTFSTVAVNCATYFQAITSCRPETFWDIKNNVNRLNTSNQNKSDIDTESLQDEDYMDMAMAEESDTESQLYGSETDSYYGSWTTDTYFEDAFSSSESIDFDSSVTGEDVHVVEDDNFSVKKSFWKPVYSQQNCKSLVVRFIGIYAMYKISQVIYRKIF